MNHFNWRIAFPVSCLTTVQRYACLLALSLTVTLPNAASAVLIAEDTFLTSPTPTGAEYAVGTLSGQGPTISGFTGNWSTSSGTSASVISTSLNYTDTLETGGSLLSPTGDSRVHRSLASSTNPFQSGDSGTVYLAFLLQTGDAGGYRAFEMHNLGTSDGPNRKFQIGYSTFGDFPDSGQFGFRVNNSGAFDYTLGPIDDAVHLFVAKFQMSTSSNADVITVWNNPDITGDLSSDPAGGVTATGFNFAVDRLGAGHFGGTQYGFDELRIGTTLADVVEAFLYCDFNDNGVCNSTDFQTLSENMFLPGSFEDGDINDDGIVDFADYRLFKDHPSRVAGFDEEGAGSETSVFVPEPAGVLLLCIALLSCTRLIPQKSRRKCVELCLVAFVLIGTTLGSTQAVHAAAQDLLNDTITFSGETLNFRPYATMPGGFSNIIEMTHKPGDTRFYVPTEQGTIFVINEDLNGNTSAVPWFDAASALQTATGRSINITGGVSQSGLQSVAFHPDFEKSSSPGYGKLYTTMLENRPANPNDPEHFYLGSSTYGGGGADGVLAEWTYNFNTGQVEANSYRELFRTNMPNYDHPIKLAQFDPYAKPGDEDYGLLYMTHGDSNSQDSPDKPPDDLSDPQNRATVLGKMLRINPLQSGDDRYTVPSTNPFYSDSSPTETGILGEVYAYGYRNPHNFSFNPDGEGNINILVGDIGRSNMEEINTAVPGGNYGWSKREGTFVHLQGNDYPPNPDPDAGYFYGVDDLPANEATIGVGPDGNNYIYPVAQYDHNGTGTNLGDDYTATSVASGFVINNGSAPALQNQFIFHNFAFNHGDVYHTDFDEMLNAVTQLDPDDPNRDEPGELTQAQLYRYHLALDDDNNPNTAPVTSDNLNTLLGTFRNDGRYGEGISGEMYVSSKNGNIYLVTDTLPDNRLTLTVDRDSGEMTITNSTGSDIEIEGIGVYSPSGSLTPGQLQAVDGGWTLASSNSARVLDQSNDSGSFELTDVNSAALGDIYDPQLVAFGQPAGEDVQFVFYTSGPSSHSFIGDVEYVGESNVPNTIVLTVDIGSGEAAMLNQTPFAQEVEGYTVVSDGDQLNAAGWESLDSQGIDGGDWQASPPDGSHRLTEITENGTTTFDESGSFSLGQIFQTGQEGDLEFAFLLDGEGEARQGMVQYILAGDYNNDGKVSAADYTEWRDHLGSNEGLPNDLTPEIVDMDDYEMWLTNFGKVLPEFGSGSGSSSSSVSVPEPASLGLLGMACLALVAARNRKLRRA